MIVYEAYNSTTVVQFLNQEDRDSYAATHNMQTREVEINIPVPTKTPSKEDWIAFSQSMWDNTDLFLKIITNSNPNGYATLLKVLTDGERSIAVENALLVAIDLLGISFNESEKSYINNNLEKNNFNIRIN